MSTITDKVKSKILALLKKTTDNGCTEAEMNAAIEKANELMKEYCIDPSELKDAIVNETPLKKRVPMYPGFSYHFILNDISKYFDCKYYINGRSEVVFVGYEWDVEMCIYFYQLIFETMKRECSKKRMSYIRFNTTSFKLGFCLTVAEKFNGIVKQRENESSNEFALVLLDKNKLVDNYLKDSNLDIKGKKSSFNQSKIDANSYNAGVDAGKKFEINKPLS